MNFAPSRAWSLVALLAASACALAQPAARPPLWKVSDDDNHIYLLGSFHALKPSDYPISATVDAAFDDAETVAFEISPEEMASPELPRKMMAAGVLPEGETLRQKLSAGGWHRLELYAGRRGMDLQPYSRMEPWILALVISMQELNAIGYDPKQGLDQQLIARSGQAHKTTLGLESGDDQIAALDSMSPGEQEQSLAEALDDAAGFKLKMDKLHDSWRAGDVAALNEMLTGEFKRTYPQLYQRIDVARNKAWLPKLQRMLDEEHHRDTLVVVGTMHLLGPDGLVSQLQSRGYRVERL